MSLTAPAMTLPALAMSHACYSVATPFSDGRELFIGVDRLTQLSTLPAARQNSEFNRLVPDYQPFTLTVHYIGNEIEARHRATILIQATQPHCNLAGVQVEPTTSQRRSRGRVRCLDTLEVFETAASAAKHAGCTPQYMSMHLKGQTPAVMGRRYERMPV